MDRHTHPNCPRYLGVWTAAIILEESQYLAVELVYVQRRDPPHFSPHESLLEFAKPRADAGSYVGGVLGPHRQDTPAPPTSTVQHVKCNR